VFVVSSRGLLRCVCVCAFATGLTRRIGIGGGGKEKGAVPKKEVSEADEKLSIIHRISPREVISKADKKLGFLTVCLLYMAKEGDLGSGQRTWCFNSLLYIARSLLSETFFFP
jgi:hypothetical protein